MISVTIFYTLDNNSPCYVIPIINKICLIDKNCLFQTCRWVNGEFQVCTSWHVKVYLRDNCTSKLAYNTVDLRCLKGSLRVSVPVSLKQSGYVNQHTNYQTTACKISLIQVCYSCPSSLLISIQTLVTVQTLPTDRISRSTFCVCLSVMTHPSLWELLAVRNKQVFVSRKSMAHSCRVRVHMQGSEVGWSQPSGSRMFKTTIMSSQGTLVFGPDVDACLGETELVWLMWITEVSLCARTH